MEFSGAKLAVFLGPDLLVIHRDNKPDIPYPDHWDLPGGGREGRETPLECALRETQEEVGLNVPLHTVNWANSYLRPRGAVWFFAAHLPLEAEADVRFGDEGQGWRLMQPMEFCRHPMAIGHYAGQVLHYMRQPEFPGNL